VLRFEEGEEVTINVTNNSPLTKTGFEAREG